MYSIDVMDVNYTLYLYYTIERNTYLIFKKIYPVLLYILAASITGHEP